MASICPSSGRKKNWMPRLACSLVRVVGEVGVVRNRADGRGGEPPIGLVNVHRGGDGIV